MKLDVRWTDEAEFTFDQIVNFINGDWGENAGMRFRDKVLRVLDSISTQPLLFPETGMPGVRKAVITGQTSLFYEVLTNKVVLLFFWDNRQRPIPYL